MMKRGAAAIIVNSCIWGLVIIACSLALKGTEAFKEIQTILVGGAGASLLVVYGAFGRRKPQGGQSD